ncbi:hypothetical protein [Rathayibacter sp. Leaf296]|uniref:hypothetical protein n=1 Tax=Rathayibacter sp. Leaf296 TaxID=1736327 RepID=UPI0007039535|nr:hypothetical protein [Rathayibacter sp. Leaf296]KQQ08423.1 hypothetical protein ASF46_14060 [Rathayibacter sp. Leaf296]
MTLDTTSRTTDDTDDTDGGADIDGTDGGADVDGAAAAPAQDLAHPGAVFTAVTSGGLEQWRIVAVLGIRVLAERLEGAASPAGSERRSFTLRFVRYRLSLPSEIAPESQERRDRR